MPPRNESIDSKGKRLQGVAAKLLLRSRVTAPDVALHLNCLPSAVVGRYPSYVPSQSNWTSARILVWISTAQRCVRH